MRKFQCLLFALKRSYICYYIICMKVPLTIVTNIMTVERYKLTTVTNIMNGNKFMLYQRRIYQCIIIFQYLSLLLERLQFDANAQFAQQKSFSQNLSCSVKCTLSVYYSYYIHTSIGVVLVSLLLTLNIFHKLFQCLYC